VNAVRFKATLGSDYPPGNEAQRRKVCADSLRVELVDGRVQEISLKNFDGSGRDIELSLVESKDGKELRREESAAKEAAR
jgi:hypothetical protein